MAWLDRFRWGRKSSTLDILRELYGAIRGTKAGRSVTLDRALQVSTVFACCRVIGNGMAQVPFKLMRASPDGRSRMPATDHPLYKLMGSKPNSWMTSFEFRQVMSWHLELSGHFIAWKIAPAGTITELIPLDPARVKITRPEYAGPIKYEFKRDDGTYLEIPPEQIWHVRGPSWNGWDGLDWLRYAREAIGLAMVTEETQSAFHENGIQTTGAWSLEGKLGSEQHDQLLKWLKRDHMGPDKSGTPLILDRAAKWVSQQMTGVDAQHLETRRHQVEEVCRQMGLMPIMVGYYDKAATYASAEQMFLAHMVHCLSPRWQMYEQSADVNLLTEKDRGEGLYFDFVEEGMIRGSVKDTKDAILGYVNGGILTPNEGRALLDRNPDDDPESDELRIPVTTVQTPEPGDPSTEPDPAAKAIEALGVEVRALASRPPPQINVDARTTISEGAVKVAPPAITVDARTSIEPGAVHLDAPVHVTNTVEPAAPVIKAYPAETEETITRDSKGEIKTIVKRAKE